jgi:uncharacterized membrane protein
MNWIRQSLLHILGLKRRWLGLIVGCLFWLAWMICGFWATILLLFLAAVGFAVGRVLEERQSWKDILNKLLSERFGE